MNIIEGNEPVINEASLDKRVVETQPTEEQVRIANRNNVLRQLAVMTDNRTNIMQLLETMSKRKPTSIYIVVEGPDNTGKSTVIKTIGKLLSKNHITCDLVAEPGSTKVGNQLRTILKSTKLPAISQFNLMQVSRTCLLDEVILPNMLKGTVTVSDRNLLSSVVYQGMVGGCEAAIDISVKTAKTMCPTYTAWLIPSKEDYAAHLEVLGIVPSDALEEAYDPEDVRDKYQELFGLSVIGSGDSVPELNVSNSNFSRRNRLFTNIDSVATAQAIVDDIINHVIPAEKAASVNLLAQYTDELAGLNKSIKEFELVIADM